MAALTAFVIRAALLAALWLMLFPAPGPAWAIGAVVVGLAAWRSVVLVPPQPGRPSWRWLVLPPLFLWASAGSAVQVAWRALAPWGRVHPGSLEYRPRTSTPGSTMALAWVISAMPGTLVGDMRSEAITVHVLDRHQPNTRSIAVTEQHIAWALGHGREARR